MAILFGSPESKAVIHANKELAMSEMHKGETRMKRCDDCGGSGVCSVCNGHAVGDNCYCLGDGTCIYCDGKGVYKTEWRKGTFGWGWYEVYA